jgi:hypothetical protein
MVKMIKTTLEDLKSVIHQLGNENYTTSFSLLNNATIGQHSRHIVELFQCLLNSYTEGIVFYDNRKRDIKIETDTTFALETIDKIITNLDKQDKPLRIVHTFGDEKIIATSTYLRELIFNFDHCLHHQALIKVGLLQLNSVSFSEEFGIAPSTLAHKNQCVQ